MSAFLPVFVRSYPSLFHRKQIQSTLLSFLAHTSTQQTIDGGRWKHYVSRSILLAKPQNHARTPPRHCTSCFLPAFLAVIC